MKENSTNLNADINHLERVHRLTLWLVIKIYIVLNLGLWRRVLNRSIAGYKYTKGVVARPQTAKQAGGSQADFLRRQYMIKILPTHILHRGHALDIYAN